MENCCRAEQTTDDKISRRMLTACWIKKAANTHSGYVTLAAFPRQEYLRERPSVLRYTYIARRILYVSHYTSTFILIAGTLQFHTRLPLLRQDVASISSEYKHSCLQ